MKGYLVLIAAALVGSNAFASKARVSSLQGANHLIDTQTVFTVPSHLNLLNPYLTFEFGTAGTEAEGGIMRNVGSGKLLLYVGHQNSTETDLYGDGRTARSYIEQRNPVEAIYSFGNMGFGASLSHAEDKTAGDKETSVILKWGMNVVQDGWVYAHLHAWDSAERRNTGVTDKQNTMPYLTLGGALPFGQFRVFAEGSYGATNTDPGAAGAKDTDNTDTDLTVGIEDRSLRNDKADIYYGIKAVYANRSGDGIDVYGYKLPAFIGIEMPVVSWATFRASVQQNILVGQVKDENTTGAKEDSVTADTKVAAGLGLKYGSLVLDGTLTSASNGNINGNQFISQAAVTYWF